MDYFIYAYTKNLLGFDRYYCILVWVILAALIICYNITNDEKCSKKTIYMAVILMVFGICFAIIPSELLNQYPDLVLYNYFTCFILSCLTYFFAYKDWKKMDKNKQEKINRYFR